MNYYENRRQRIMASLANGDCILDVGCAHRPNPYLHSKRVIGLDLIDMDIRPPYTEHIVGDIAELGTLLPGQMFDTILMGELIEHGPAEKVLNSPEQKLTRRYISGDIS